MQADALEVVLSQFGITQQQIEDGQPKWIINIVTDKTGYESRSAYFDERLGIWSLHPLQDRKPLRLQTTPGSGAKIRHDGLALRPSEKNWTDVFPGSPHTDLLLNLDWASTGLGPLDGWPHSLRLYTQMLLSDTRAAAIYWGPQRIAIYNEPLLPLIGALHPQLLGHSFEEIMPEMWDFFGPLFHTIERDQQGFAQNGLELPTMRFGYLEESWWDGGLVALRDDNGDYGGTYFSWTEVTRSTLRDRRTKIINQLRNLSLTSISSFWTHIHDILAQNPRDIPMAIMYSTDQTNTSDETLILEHTIGLSPAYAAAPSEIQLTSNGDESAALTPLLLQARDSEADFTIIALAEQSINPTIIEGVDWLGFGEPSKHLAIIPVKDRQLIRGFVVLGLNPRRDLDEDHEQFITELTRQLSETLIKISFQQQHQEREKDLTIELNEVEARASRMAEIVPVGIYELSANGTLQWANNQFFELMGVPQGHRDLENFAWTSYILPEDHERANEKMAECLLQGFHISDTLRLKRDWRPPASDGDERSSAEPFWIMYSASPNYGLDGSIRSLTGSITDISHLKWAEQLQIRNAEAAQRDRCIQEEFIDITSHEMRNPLSAITQSADGILLSRQDAEKLNSIQSLKDLIEQHAEAAESIIFCAMHQRRIIDDILTLGKLDSKLLAISPVAFRLDDLVDQAMHMFQAEFEVNKIQVERSIDGDEAKAVSQMFQGDSSRLTQVLMNLLTNAIKFTKTQSTKRISVRHGWSHTVPPAQSFGPHFKWYCTETPRPDLIQEPEYGKGPPLYVYFAVTDSGVGIQSNALARIFTKFEQADRRTHTKYGGSGLGLYISRELTEMQGGRIGIESVVSVGSTFAFYAKVRSSDVQGTQGDISVKHGLAVAKTVDAFDSLRVSTIIPTPDTPPSQCDFNILLVEDNELNQKVLAKQLRRAGCSVETSNHGGEAVDYIARMHGQPMQYDTILPENMLGHFDCILMDWEMPVCDGMQATKAIRNIEARQGFARSLIIGITANARTEQIATAIEAGMDAVVPKPFRVAELLSRINDFTRPS